MILASRSYIKRARTSTSLSLCLAARSCSCPSNPSQRGQQMQTKYTLAQALVRVIVTINYTYQIKTRRTHTPSNRVVPSESLITICAVSRAHSRAATRNSRGEHKCLGGPGRPCGFAATVHYPETYTESKHETKMEKYVLNAPFLLISTSFQPITCLHPCTFSANRSKAAEG